MNWLSPDEVRAWLGDPGHRPYGFRDQMNEANESFVRALAAHHIHVDHGLAAFIEWGDVEEWVEVARLLRDAMEGK